MNPNLDPAADAKDSPVDLRHHKSDSVATPEGDNEFAPDQPLKPIYEGHQKVPAIDTNEL